MKITNRIEDQFFIINPTGTFADDDCQALQQLLDNASRSFCRHVLVDLNDLQTITPAGQRVILSYISRLQDLNMSLVLCRANDSIRQAVNHSGLDLLLPVATTLQEAKAIASA